MFFRFIIIFLIIEYIRSVCIEIDCPYKCCIDNDRCNPRLDCLLENEEYCTRSSDCLSGCCHGKICRENTDCEDYQLTTGLVLGFFYLIILCCAINYCYSWYASTKQKKKLIVNKKVADIYQGYMAKNVAKMVPNLMSPNEFTKKEKKDSKAGEVCNLNSNEHDDEVKVNINETPIKKIPVF